MTDDLPERAPHATEATESRRAGERPDVLLVGFVAGTGGVSVLMLELAARLIGRGLRTEIVVPAADSTESYAERCRERGVPVTRTELLADAVRTPIRGRLAALGFVRRFRAPVVHYQVNENALPHQFLDAMSVARTAPAFVTYQSTHDEPLPGDPWARHWARVAARHFHKVICVTERGRERQLRFGLPPELLALIHNGVDVDRAAGGDASVAYRALGVPEGAPLVVFTARMEQQKRPLDAIAAFARVAGEFPDARLVLVGAGSLEGEAREAADASGAGDRVHLVGHRYDIPDWLAAATVWTLPTETEGFSVGVIEAMAAGRAVLSTVCPGNDEVLVDGRNSLLAPVGDVDAQAAALRRLLAGAALRERLGAAARRDAAHYSIERMVDDHVACYAEALERARPAEGLAAGPADVGHAGESRRRRRDRAAAPPADAARHHSP